jgi:HAE1 family hydrophobic/amphiphilic exporter-1
MSIFGGFRQPIQIYVQGPEPTRLKLAAEQVLATVRAVPGVAEPSSSDDGEIPQLDVRVDRQQAWAAGLAMQTIGGTLQPLFQGQRATRWEDPNGYSHDVMVVYPDSSRVSPEDVARIPVLSNNIDPRTGQQVTIPLSQVAEIRPGVGPQQIERGYLERRISISAGVLPGFSMGNVADDARDALSTIGLPTGYRTIFGGDVQNLTETKGFVLEALLLAVVFIYLIIASIFGSFIQPLSIMLALPLSFLGVALGLLVTNGSLNVMSMIGIIMLMGLVTKNGILLIDFVNKEREAGDDLRDGAAGAGDRGGGGAAGADGARGDRRVDHLDIAHALRRPCGVYAARRPLDEGAREEGEAGPAAAGRGGRSRRRLIQLTNTNDRYNRCVVGRGWGSSTWRGVRGGVPSCFMG